jgi:hypothetical protein
MFTSHFHLKRTFCDYFELLSLSTKTERYKAQGVRHNDLRVRLIGRIKAYDSMVGLKIHLMGKA